MACENQIQLSTYIKSIHSKLRENSDLLGFEEAWKNHCKNDKMLEEYSIAMKTLALSHWHNNLKNDSSFSRVEWIYNYSHDYYSVLSNELLKHRNKELGVANKMGIKPVINLSRPSEKLKLLDVGSCYNPFSVYDEFEVRAIDIAPAVPSVEKLDFINVELSQELNSMRLPLEYFDIVVFSLFLEYLPTPNLRLLSCEKAYKLLKSEGLLFIITPDSKHVGANSKIIKSWRFILAEIGFSRIKYEKLKHIHCMVFRKSLDKRVTKRWVEIHKNLQAYDNIYIPQDFNRKTKEQNNENKFSYSDQEKQFDFPFSTMELDDDDYITEIS